VGELFDSDGRKENRNLFALRLLFTETVSRVFFMTQTPAERDTQANIQEIISAIAGVQAIITADVESSYCDTIVRAELGKAYCYLAKELAQRAIRLHLEL
jgi:hypothetical protein